MSNPHLHSAKVTIGTAINRPYHAQCSCGTAGDFADKDSAAIYVAKHFASLGGIAEASLEVTKETGAPTPAPAQDEKHVPGIGVMPASHAPGPSVVPSPPPASEEAK
jgi:hypothetical protein